jgi:hypothetical protein
LYIIPVFLIWGAIEDIDIFFKFLIMVFLFYVLKLWISNIMKTFNPYLLKI